LTFGKVWPTPQLTRAARALANIPRQDIVSLMNRDCRAASLRQQRMATVAAKRAGGRFDQGKFIK
jgi:hypothetical protein